MSTPPSSTPSKDRRVQAVVGLKLLEVIREVDAPGEILEAEDPTQTMPRRLGLSDVVERQIRTYRSDVKKRVRLTDSEIIDLFRLVVRRPDAEEVFFKAGLLMAADARPGPWGRMAPRRIRYALVRRRAARRLKKLFGRRVGGFGRGPFTIEGRSLLFIESDPEGAACNFLSGLSQGILEQTMGRGAIVEHSLCQGRGDDRCRWEGGLPTADGPAVPGGDDDQ